MTRYVLPTAIVTLAAILAVYLNTPTYGGAHPIWTDKVVYIGAPLGLILGLLLSNLHYVVRTVGFGALTIATLFAAYWGKLTFAASYAENTFAGQIWYFGWIGVCTFTAAFLASFVLHKK